jgi:hypothetical protein
MASAIDELGDYMVEIVDKCEERGMASAIDELGDYMVEIVDKCEERGMQVPFIVCAASPNGSVACARVCRDGSAPDILAEHLEAEGYRAADDLGGRRPEQRSCARHHRAREEITVPLARRMRFATP